MVITCLNVHILSFISCVSCRGKNNVWQLKNLILTLLGLIFRRIYTIWYLPSIINNFEISGTDVVCGYHLLRCSYNILYFLWLYNEFFIILYNILKNCRVRLLSNNNIKYTCTIYTHLDKVTLRLLKLQFYRADVVEWSRALDIRLSDWRCSVSMVWAQFPSREEHKFDSSNKSNANTIWFNFQTYI